MNQPLLVFTGGDPLMRPDLFALAEYAIEKGAGRRAKNTKIIGTSFIKKLSLSGKEQSLKNV